MFSLEKPGPPARPVLRTVLEGATCSQLGPGGVSPLQGLELPEPCKALRLGEREWRLGDPGLGLAPSKASWL